MKLFLSEHKGDARPDTLIYLQVADVHPIAKEFDVRVEEAPWGYEIELRDPDTNRLRIGMPKPASKACDESTLRGLRPRNGVLGGKVRHWRHRTDDAFA